MLRDNAILFKDTFVLSAARESYNTTNIYLKSGETFTNETQYIVPCDCKLIAITASTHYTETWLAEIHSNNILMPGALCSIVSAKWNHIDLDVIIECHTPLSMYCNGTNISHPRILAFFRRI